VHTAGAISLVAQSFVPVAAFAGRVSRVSLTGGTDVSNAPPIGYLKHCLAPCLRAHLGIEIDAEVTRRGYFPRGGGEATLTVVPGLGVHASEPKASSWHPYPPFTIERARPGRGGDGEPAKLGCWIVNGAPDGPRQQTESRAAAAAALRSLLTKSPTIAIAAEAMARAGVPVDCRTAVEPGSGDGGSVLLSAASVDGTCVLAVGLVFEPPKKRRAATTTDSTDSTDSTNDEKEHANARVKALVALASRAGEALGELVESGAAVDDHLLDQLIVFMALADGRGGKKSRVVARAPLSKHAETAIDVCRRVVGARFEVLEGKAGGGHGGRGGGRVRRDRRDRQVTSEVQCYVDAFTRVLASLVSLASISTFVHVTVYGFVRARARLKPKREGRGFGTRGLGREQPR
jgi:RNA 3'-terminal phosphate cyclase (ATP)